MTKSFSNIEDVLADESFQAWHYKESEQAIRVWEDWLRENPQYNQIVEEATSLLNGIKVREQEVATGKVDIAYQRLVNRLQLGEQPAAPVVPIRRTGRRWWVAAAAILVIAAAAAFWKFSASKAVIETPYGQLARHQLPDGSEVMLNANSAVTLSEGWDEGKDREVWLKGEAFFQVAKTAKKTKFIVHTDQLDVIVTGTKFNVSNRDGKTRVFLAEGGVTIQSHDGKQIAMHPGDFVEIQRDIIEKKVADEESVLAWKDNKLSFYNTPMKEAIRTISDHYGVKISIEGKDIGEKTITGIMPNDNLDVLLKALEATTSFRISRHNNEIVILEP
jgi:transmembrane sensor